MKRREEVRLPDDELGTRRRVVEARKLAGWELVGFLKEVVLVFEREVPEPQTAEQVAKQDKLLLSDLDEADDLFSGISLS